MTHIKLTNIDASFYLKFKIENGKLKVMKKPLLILMELSIMFKMVRSMKKQKNNQLQILLQMVYE